MEAQIIAGKFVPSSNYNYRLTLEEIDKIYYAFTIFDPEGDGVIQSIDVPTILRALGELIIEGQAKKMTRKYFDKNGMGAIDFTAFLVGMANYYKDQYTYDERTDSWRRPEKREVDEIVNSSFLVTFPDESAVTLGVIESQLSVRGDIVTDEELVSALEPMERNSDREFEIYKMVEELLKPIETEVDRLREATAISPKKMSPASKLKKKLSFAF
jgi:Ca2+-binding EF-hand superfamily protein